MGGKTSCLAKASDRMVPVLTSSRTALMCGVSFSSVRRSASRSRLFKMGKPARISVTNC